jgi:hypothetical protein
MQPATLSQLEPQPIKQFGLGLLCSACLAMLFAGGCTKAPPTKPAYPNSWQVGYQLIREREGWRSDDFFSDPKYLEICKAISYRDDAKLTELIKDNVDLNVQGVNGFTLLYWAFVEHNLSAFKILLERGANPDLALSQTIEGEALLLHHQRQHPLYQRALHASSVLYGRVAVLEGCESPSRGAKRICCTRTSIRNCPTNQRCVLSLTRASM